MDCSVRAFPNYPGSDLLSRKLYRHYHRPCGVSRPCSGWERVGPPRHDYREMGQAVSYQFLAFSNDLKLMTDG